MSNRATLDSAQKIDAARQAASRGDAAQALHLLGEVLAAEPRNAAALHARAGALAASGRHGDALDAYAAAASVDPASALVRGDYARALIAAGEFDAAERELVETLRLAPDSAVALRSLAWLKRAVPGDAIIERLIAARARPGLGDADYTKLSYALGKCYDDIGEFDLAFIHFREANERRGGAYDAAAYARLFADIKSVFDRAFFKARKNAGHESAKPVFVLGMPRSGSSLIEEKLTAQPEFAGLGECAEIARIATALAAAHPRRALYPHFASDIPLRAFAGLGGHYVTKFERIHPLAAHFVDKSLMNFAYIGLIKAILPNALVVETRRNAIDTCLSCYFHDLNPEHSYAFDLATLGDFYRSYASLMEHWRSQIEGLLAIQYEEFVETPEAHLKALRKRLGREGDGEDMADAGARTYIRTWSAVQARQPINKDSVARWKHYEKHLGPLIEALGDRAG